MAAVHAQEEAGKIQLTTEQHYLLDKYYKEFIRSGAGLDAQSRNVCVKSTSSFLH